jgi:Ca-activated chloride channel family protein
MTGFSSPEKLELLWVIVPIACLFAWAAWRKRTLLSRMGDVALIGRLIPPGLRLRRAVSAALIIASVACIAIAAARPRGEPLEQTATVSGRDVAFLVDVSRSMLATDVAPTRLERSKLWIKDVLNTLDGDRAALVAFAGTASIKCPLTLDRAFLEMQIDDLSPSSVSRGGSLIGDAIRKTVNEVFMEETARHRDIIIFTDGEDQESFPVEAARAAAERGVRIITIGIGSDTTGAPVPAASDRPNPGFMTHQGERVMSRLDAKVLSDIATASAGGAFLNVGTGNIELDRVYADLAANLPKAEIVVDKTTVYEELFQAPLLLAFLLLALEAFIRDR